MATSTTTLSPFVYGRPVRSDEFLNRRGDLRTILNRLRHVESTAIVGEPHIGKSSLLLKLSDEDTQQAYLGEDAYQITTCLLDLHPIGNAYTPAAFWREVLEPLMFCNPVDKVHGTVTTTSYPDNHLTVYNLNAATDWWTVTVDNQFNDAAVPQELLVWGPVALAVPTQKVVPGDHGMPKYVDHYLLYQVWEPVPVDVNVDLDDQFPDVASNVSVGPPLYFANPAVKGYVDHSGLWDPDEHLVFYAISDNPEFLPLVEIMNQFFPEFPVPLELIPAGQMLAVPSVKVEWAPADPPLV